MKVTESILNTNICGWCSSKLCDSQKFNNTCFNCGKSPYSKITKKEVMKASYLKWKGEYLLMDDSGKTHLFSTKENFNKYLTENNYRTID